MVAKNAPLKAVTKFLEVERPTAPHMVEGYDARWKAVYELPLGNFNCVELTEVNHKERHDFRKGTNIFF